MNLYIQHTPIAVSNAHATYYVPFAQLAKSIIHSSNQETC